MPQSFLDSVDGPVLFSVTVILLAIAGELGFRAANRLGKPQQESQANVVTGALLGILGLLLAFSFGIVEARFAERKALIVKEANAIEAAYLRSSLIPEPHAARAQRLLRAYVDANLRVQSMADTSQALVETAAQHGALWQEASAAAHSNTQSVAIALFVDSINQLIEAQHERVTVVLYHRLPMAMLITLYVVAAFSLALHGYCAGLVRVRVPLPAIGLIVSLTSVLFLIVELDRPWKSVFHVSQDPLIRAREVMSP